MTTYFLHGLDSSGRGTKGSWLSRHFPQVLCPDFSGDLEQRLTQLHTLCGDESELVFIGSSFGGLKATCYAIRHPDQVRRLILLAPALNFEFTPPREKIAAPTLLVIGRRDVVTPPNPVVSLARQSFSNLEIRLVEDDHLLHGTFAGLEWTELLEES